MVGNLRYPLMVAVVAATLTGQVAQGQTSGALPSATPIFNVDGAFRSSPGPAPAPIPCDRTSPAEGPDPFLEPDVLPPSGWFVNVDTIFQSVHLRDHLMG